jgi:hypothetical protein
MMCPWSETKRPRHIFGKYAQVEVRLQFRSKEENGKLIQKGGRKADTAIRHATTWYTQCKCIKCFPWKATATNIPKEIKVLVSFWRLNPTY